MVEVETREYRESTLQDLFDAARIVDSLDNIHFLQRPMVARDITDNFELDLNTLYACVSGTTKHIGTSFGEPDFVPGCFDLIHDMAGGEAAWRARPFISNSNCFVVPPMKFAMESCRVMEECIKRGMPVLLLSAGQAGATAPATIAGAIVQACAECLAGIVYVNAIAPGGEQALLTAGCAQMHKFYGLPGGAAAGIADSKLPDMQAGWEQATSNVMVLGFCHESLILGDDLLGQAMRCVRGIEVNDDTIGLEVMRSVCLDGPGHYLGHEQTLARMQRDYIYPTLGDRSSPKEWMENEKPDLLVKAKSRKETLLAQPSKALLPSELDAQIRQKFPIRLPQPDR